MKKHLSLLFALCFSCGLFAQEFDLPCCNRSYKAEVQTVQLYRDGDQLADPIVSLDDMVKRLTLSFDVIAGQGDVLNYTFIHCTHDWYPTDMQRMQYASGFGSNRIDDFAFSVNTLVDYVNYRLVFPQEDMCPLVSGNYLLVVFGDDMRKDNVYLTSRFMVVDRKTQIKASVPRYPDDLSLTDTHQQVNVMIGVDGNISPDIQQYGNLTIRQNGRWDNAVEGLKPSYVYPDRISFEHNPLSVFEAANQYRRFNTSNRRFQSENIAHIRQTDQWYEVDIATCELRDSKAYATYDDIHGEKFVYLEDENLDNATEADYMRVNFFLKCDSPFQDADVYVMGALNDWRFDENNKMSYDSYLHGYCCSMLLKQGYYNFMFVTADPVSGAVSTRRTAGNHWETNNVYSLYYYLYNPMKGYDELIGHSVFNSH